MIVVTSDKYEELYKEYYSIVSKVAYSYTRNIEDSQDIAQEVFIKLYRAHRVFNDDDHLTKWLIRVTINKSIDLLRQKKREIIVDTEYVNNLQDKEEHDEKSLVMYDAVGSLKDIYKTVIILHYYDDYSIKDIASILKISENNVKVRLNRAREKLKQIINERAKKDE